jgi:hypothetical protein
MTVVADKPCSLCTTVKIQDERAEDWTETGRFSNHFWTILRRCVDAALRVGPTGAQASRLQGPSLLSLMLTISLDRLHDPQYKDVAFFSAHILFGKGKCHQAAVPATVPSTKAHNATVVTPWEGELVGSSGARRPDPKSIWPLGATGDCRGGYPAPQPPHAALAALGFVALGR